MFIYKLIIDSNFNTEPGDIGDIWKASVFYFSHFPDKQKLLRYFQEKMEREYQNNPAVKHLVDETDSKMNYFEYKKQIKEYCKYRTITESIAISNPWQNIFNRDNTDVINLKRVTIRKIPVFEENDF